MATDSTFDVVNAVLIDSVLRSTIAGNCNRAASSSVMLTHTSPEA